MLLPVPAPPFGTTQPDERNSQALDPALNTLGAFFKALLEHYCDAAWSAIAPAEPIVRVLSVGHDPEDLDFHDGMLPLLALWREHDGQPVRLQDGNTQAPSIVNVLWVAPAADEQKLAARSPFFNVFCKVMQHAFQQERDPCWIKPGEEDDVVARTYGSYVWGHAGIDNWNYSGTRRVPVVIPTARERETYPGFLALWTIQESTTSDPAAYGSTIDGVRVGTGDTSVFFNLPDRDPDDPDALIRQSALVPADDD